MSRITDLLNEIVSEALKLGIDVQSGLYPGATPAQVVEAVRALPFELPSEVIELFQWRNGVRPEGQARECSILPGFVWQSIADSVATTGILVSAADDPEMQWQKSWFCLWTDLAGDCYAIDASPDPARFGRITYVQGGFEPQPAFLSLQTMLLSILECYRARAYSLDENGFLIEDSYLSDLIYRSFNQGMSPHRIESKEDLRDKAAGARERFEREGRPDLIEKLQDLMRRVGVNLDDPNE